MSLSVGSVFGIVAFEDAASSVLGKITDKLGVVGTVAASIAATASAATAGLVALGVRGAAVNDAAEAFSNLSARVNETGASMLGALRRGTLGTISDFELMKLANRSMGAGLKATSADFEVLASGAKLLADRTGVDTTQAFETLTSAMTTGRTMGLKQLGLFVDLSAAQEQWRFSTNKLTGDLSDSQRQQLSQTAILERLRKELKEAGPNTKDFADVVDQMKVSVTNLTDKLGSMIATSPAVQAFLSNVQDMFQALIDVIDKNADTIMKFVKGGLMGLFFALIGGALIVEGFIVTLRTMTTTVLDATAALYRGAAAVLNFAAAVESKLGQSAVAEKFRDMAKSHQEAADKLKSWSDTASSALGKAEDVTMGMVDALIDMTNKIANADAVGKKTSETLTKMGTSSKQAADGLASLSEIAEQLQKDMEAADRVAEKFENARRLLGVSSKQAEQQTKDLALSVSLLGGVTKLTDNELIALVTQLDALVRSGRAPEEAFTALAQAMEEAAQRGEHVAEGVGLVKKKIQETKPEVASFAKIFQNELLNAFAKMPEVIIGAIQGGGDVGKALGSMFGTSIGESLKKQLAKTLSGSGVLGQMLSSALPGIGALLGSGIGSVITNVIGKIFSSEGKKVNDMRDAFIASAGGLDALRLAAFKAGMTLEELLKVKRVDDFKNAVQHLQDAFDLQKQAQEKLNKALDEWGFTVDEMGPKLAGQRIVDQLMAMFEQFELLSNAGVNMGAIMDHMGPKMAELVDAARRTGTALPRAMEPMVNALIASGQLLDENGNAFASAEEAGITFADTMTDEIKKLVEQIERLVNAMMGVSDFRLPGVPHGGPGGGGADEGPRGPVQRQAASGGIFTGPTRTLLGEAGPEAVLPLSNLRDMLDMGGSFLPVIFKIGERELVNAMAELRRDNRAGARTLLG